MQTKTLNILLEEANNLVERLNYAEAIECGSTFLRLGSVIFGKRDKTI